MKSLHERAGLPKKHAKVMQNILIATTEYYFPINRLQWNFQNEICVLINQLIVVNRGYEPASRNALVRNFYVRIISL